MVREGESLCVRERENFRVQSLGLRVASSGFRPTMHGGWPPTPSHTWRANVSGCSFWGLSLEGSRTAASKKIKATGYPPTPTPLQTSKRKREGFALRVSGFQFRVSDFGFRVSGFPRDAKRDR